MKNLIICGIVMCLFSACLEKINPDQLHHSNWELIEIPGFSLPTTAKATLNFADSLKISGKSFCNSYGGQAAIVDHKVTLKNIFSTKMFCQDTDAAERAYLQAMNQVNGAKMLDDKLYLLHEGKTLLVFRKTN